MKLRELTTPVTIHHWAGRMDKFALVGKVDGYIHAVVEFPYEQGHDIRVAKAKMLAKALQELSGDSGYDIMIVDE